MALNEGLTGLVAEQLRPVWVATRESIRATSIFAKSGEEEYRSFLGVPLIDRGVLQGVMVVQTKEKRDFQGRRDKDAG